MQLRERTLAAAIIAAVVLVVPVYAKHDKTDSVRTTDGSTYIGEIKSVEYATLVFSTNPAGTINIEWRYVTGLTSKFEYRVEVAGGTRYFGTLASSEKPGRLLIIGANGPIDVALADVVLISPVEQGFWKRLDGSLDFGLSYTQANKALQYNMNFNANYRSHGSFATLDGQSIFNQQEDGDPTNQQYLSFVLMQLTKQKWSPFELGQAQSNVSQGFDLRINLGGGAAYFIIESGRQLFQLNLGAVYSREDVADSPEVDHNAAALVGIGYRHFKRSSHSPSVQLDLTTFPYFTNTPRIRAVFNFQTRWQIIGDFTFNVQLRDNYDSNPPGTDADKNNLTFVTSVGYSF